MRLRPTVRTLFIEFPENKQTEDILTLCSCKSGRRTLAPCNHAIEFLYEILQEVEKRRNNPPMIINSQHPKRIQEPDYFSRSDCGVIHRQLPVHLHRTQNQEEQELIPRVSGR